MLKEIVMGCSHKYDFICIGGAAQHPDIGKIFDLSEDINKTQNITNAKVLIYPTNGYGDINLIRGLIKEHKPDALFIMTDPRYYEWLFDNEREIRQQIPIIYYNIWDDGPAPMYNYPFYMGCDALFGISKQTVNFNKLVLGEESKNKLIKYIPHGVNKNVFFPLEENNKELEILKKQIFRGNEYNFILFFNSRNIKRKGIPDLLLGFKLFLDKLNEEEKEKCLLLLHTDPIDPNGTNLVEVIKMIFGEETKNVIISSNKISQSQLNVLYNLANVTILNSSNEGWGLSLTESLMSGTPIIGNVTGGIQDQMKFIDNNNNWIEFNEKFYSNHLGKYKKCGDWAFPIFPKTLSLIGAIPTPYIFDDICDFRDISEAIYKAYNDGNENLKIRGMKGREWVTSNESNMSSDLMCNNIIEGIDELFKIWTPIKSYNIIDSSKKYYNKHIKYPITEY